MLVTTLAHQVTNAFVHGDAGRGDQARHTSYDAVIPRRDHVRTAAEDGDELEHVVVIRRENRRSGEEFQHGTARDGIQTLHRDEYWKNAMALAKGRGCVPKSGDVVAILTINFGPSFVE